MPIAQVRGVNINYEVLGSGGPWVALSPGGRRALDNVKSLAQHVANAGYRVLIHDRRNCGLSDIANGAELPVIGASKKDLNSIKVPTCIIPGNDKTHNHAIAETAHRMIAGSELYDLFPGDLDVDLVPPEDWAPKEAEMAAVFVDFLSRAQAKAA